MRSEQDPLLSGSVNARDRKARKSNRTLGLVIAAFVVLVGVLIALSLTIGFCKSDPVPCFLSPDRSALAHGAGFSGGKKKESLSLADKVFAVAMEESLPDVIFRAFSKASWMAEDEFVPITTTSKSAVLVGTAATVGNWRKLGTDCSCTKVLPDSPRASLVTAATLVLSSTSPGHTVGTVVHNKTSTFPAQTVANLHNESAGGVDAKKTYVRVVPRAGVSVDNVGSYLYLRVEDKKGKLVRAGIAFAEHLSDFEQAQNGNGSYTFPFVTEAALVSGSHIYMFFLAADGGVLLSRASSSHATDVSDFTYYTGAKWSKVKADAKPLAGLTDVAASSQLSAMELADKSVALIATASGATDTQLYLAANATSTFTKGANPLLSLGKKSAPLRAVHWLPANVFDNNSTTHLLVTLDSKKQQFPFVGTVSVVG
jgi:hypothetical protein